MERLRERRSSGKECCFFYNIGSGGSILTWKSLKIKEIRVR